MSTYERISPDEIEQVKAGDACAFETLYNKYKQPVYALCLRSTKHAADAEDLTQEVFLQVYRRISSLRNSAAFKSWLFRVATNIILMHGRRRRALPTVLQFIADFETSAMLELVEALTSPGCEPTERIALARAIGDLPKCRRAVLLLHDIQGMSHREIATSLGVSLSATKSNLSRARHQLRGVLRYRSLVTTLPAIRASAAKDNDNVRAKIYGKQVQMWN
jgi:RNA polymerase sigma-70 factor (ECF subfamily)